jgi:hypothetical protein
MQVGTADGGLVDLDNHVVVSAVGLGLLFHPKTDCGATFDKGFHGYLLKK